MRLPFLSLALEAAWVGWRRCGGEQRATPKNGAGEGKQQRKCAAQKKSEKTKEKGKK